MSVYSIWLIHIFSHWYSFVIIHNTLDHTYFWLVTTISFVDGLWSAKWCCGRQMSHNEERWGNFNMIHVVRYGCNSFISSVYVWFKYLKFIWNTSRLVILFYFVSIAFHYVIMVLSCTKYIFTGQNNELIVLALYVIVWMLFVHFLV